MLDFTRETAIGALANYISNRGIVDFQPMNVNFGIMDPLGERIRKKREKNEKIAARSLALTDVFAKNISEALL